MHTITDLKKVVNPLEVIGNEEVSFTRVIPFDIDNTDDGVLMWITAAKNSLISNVKAGIILCEATLELTENKNITIVVVRNARAAFRQVLEAFYKKQQAVGIHVTAIIHRNVVLGNDCCVGAYAVIEDGCIVGKNISIGHHTVVSSNTIIDDGTTIGTHCSIGSDGFGYEKDEAGHYVQIPHIGYVHVHEQVDIGNHVCIDRGTLGATVIGAWSRIDNMVHIAHNVQIGTDTLVIAKAMIAGSCQIGNDVWIAPCAAILNKVNVGDRARVGMGSMVFKHVNEGETVMGNPARVTKTV
ncbi:MAG: UDP-3-O-(3-hydroxymyristoyl)glucosamine N-acyltransferase [Chitinophagaceae bacterium]